jgi:hypothetical protein
MVFFNEQLPGYRDTTYDNLNTSHFSDEECTISPINHQIFFVTSDTQEGDNEVTTFQMFSHGHSIVMGKYESDGERGQGYIVDCCGGWEECTFEEWEEKKDNLLSVLSNGMYGE